MKCKSLFNIRCASEPIPNIFYCMTMLCAGELSHEEGYHCNGKGDSRETWLSAEIQGNVDNSCCVDCVSNLVQLQ